MSRRLTLFAVFGVLLLVITACSDSSPTETTEAQAGTSADQDPGSAADDGGDAVAPTGEPLIAGLSEIVVLGPPSSEAGEAPQFRWEPVAAAASYGLVVLGSDGPIWAWQGEETGVWLGGLPFERPPGVTGPVIVAGSCWSVVALDGDGHVVAASEFLAVSPNEPAGHSCSP